MKTIAIISIIAALGLLYSAYTPAATDFNAEFEQFISSYGRNYASEGEMTYRREIFNANMINAEELNRINPYATFGVTKFSDLSPEEMSHRMGAVDPMTSDEGKSVHTKEADTLKTIDFSDKMQAVQNQGSCGSCWAFSATAAFESRLAISSGSTGYKASEQEALDCSSTQYGCNGGWYEAVWEFVESNKFCTLDSYPYTARKTSCSKSSCVGKSNDKGYKLIAKTEAAMYDALTSGPISIAVDASTWSSYTGGVVTRSTCGTGMNHAVVIVAYDAVEDAWKVRNSWGANWGENGHIRLKQGENTCNLLYKPAYPTF
mmetsp:Transcript_8571/g.9728  ORF Transcript_8571/g.9728 Transcript_8571/m.9728 type:complete len:317 (+) Transcript_8571:26-976(+)